MDSIDDESIGAHEPGFEDPLVAEIAFAIVSELRTQTAGGRLLAETLAVNLAARLMHSRIGLSPDKDFEQRSHQGLDRRRLTRVRDYIDANLEGGNLTIARLAKVASLSQFHFARAFKAAVGNSPHQYVSAHRLERAKELLTRGDQSLLDIAVALNFSSQANFTRAFRKGTGMTPGQYRRGQLVARPRTLMQPATLRFEFDRRSGYPTVTGHLSINRGATRDDESPVA
jgi:AraC family transcriptional regulator